MGKRTWRWQAAALVLASIVLAGCGSAADPGTGKPAKSTASVAAPPSAKSTATMATPSSAAPSATTLRRFVAYRADGSPSVAVTRTSSGTCWTSSVAAPVPDAYRCFAGNEILDPCFVTTATATTALCVTSPWSSAQRLRLTAALPVQSALLQPKRPWALVLANGARCVAVTGTAPAVAGVSLAYSCADEYGAALITTRGKVMSAHYARADDTTLHTVRVAVAWRA